MKTDTPSLSKQGPIIDQMIDLLKSEAPSASHVPQLCRGTLALMRTHEFDPNATLSFERNKVPCTGTPLEAVLRIGTLYPTQKRTDWPRTITEFSEKLLKERSGSVIDPEWLASLLVLAGANPWLTTGQEQGCLPIPVAQAIEQGLCGLLVSFLSLPGTPSLEEIAAFKMRTSTQEEPEPLWAVLTTYPNAHVALPALLEHGLRLPGGKEGARLLGFATPGAIRALSILGAPALNKAQEQTVKTAWKERSKKLLLPAETVEEMTNLLWGGVAALEMSRTTVDIARLVTTPWGKYPPDNELGCNKFMANTGKERLCERGKVASGVMGGEWSLLAAAAFSRVRHRSHRSRSYPWSSAIMLGKKDNEKGALSAAINFEWRPGISINGPIIFSLLSSQDKALYEEFAYAAGIEDIQLWINQHLPDVVRFLSAITLRSGKSGAEAIQEACSYFSGNSLADVKGMDASLRVDLFQALSHPHFWREWDGWKRRTEKGVHELFQKLFPEVAEGRKSLRCFMQASEGCKVRASALLCIGMWYVDEKRNDGSTNSIIDIVFEQEDKIGGKELEAIEQFLEASSMSADPTYPLWASVIEKTKIKLATQGAAGKTGSSRRL